MARALVLAAQGVQHSNMLAPFRSYPWTLPLLDRCRDALHLDISAIITGPSEALDRTENAQPAILLATVVPAYLVRVGVFA